MVKVKDLERQIGTIDIRKFMNQYYGISHSDIKNMSHETATTFFPNLRRTSFEHIKKKTELVRQGYIVLVRDATNNIAPYIVPNVKALVETTQCNIGTLVENIITSLQITSELSESAIIVIEGNDSLDELVDKTWLKTNMEDLAHTLLDITKTSEVDGVVVTIDGHVNEMRLRQHSLEDVSSRTDSIAIVLEEDKSINFIVGGITQNDYDLLALRLGLYYCLDLIEVEFEEIQDLPPLPSKDELQKLSNYELTVLLKTYKVNKQFNYYYVVRRELIKRKKDNKSKQKQKVRQKIKYIREEE